MAGGGFDHTGAIVSEDAMGPVKIAGSLLGGDNTAGAGVDRTGYIEAQRIASLTIGGSILAGLDSSAGDLTNSGAVRVDVDMAEDVPNKVRQDGSRLYWDFQKAVPARVNFRAVAPSMRSVE